jgi:hypothetical protein
VLVEAAVVVAVMMKLLYVRLSLPHNCSHSPLFQVARDFLLLPLPLQLLVEVGSPGNLRPQWHTLPQLQ